MGWITNVSPLFISAGTRPRKRRNTKGRYNRSAFTFIKGMKIKYFLRNEKPDGRKTPAKSGA
jgi:hypothetical protein